MRRDRSKYKINNIIKQLTNDGIVTLRDYKKDKGQFKELLDKIYKILDDKKLIHTTIPFESTCEYVIILVRE